ncbi:hypothetical protein UG55_102538 [Frankia sp. EI5c]|uniref:alkaline shock response membrane anchor protein AmaP n=1 Tax=Frankia sp. EI5c TaxID=683316 RepID=UPI0007C3259C|nr:alkaline shock response membrane anchor protein AmaP [Frankia sp. EI5c]OAA25123.1 hypothetical protein UG55_102538 [Frankia sp. EI5c]
MSRGRRVASSRASASRRGRVSVVERWNRWLLRFLGLFLVGVGVVVLLAGFEVFGTSLADRPVLDADAGSFAAEHGWFWPAVGTAAGLMALGSLGWLAAQLRSGRLRGLYVIDDAVGGVRLDAAALTDAVADDLVRNPVVRTARVAMLGRPRHPVLRMSVEAQEDADARAVRSDVERRVLPRARRALGRPDLAAEIEIGVYAGAPARVR